MAGAFGGHHDHVHIGGGHDLAVMDIEAMGEQQGLAGHVLFQFIFIEFGLHVILGEDLHHLGLFGRVRGRHRLELVLQGRLVVGRPRHFSDNDVHAGIPEIQSLGVTLGAEADDGHFFAL